MTDYPEVAAAYPVLDFEEDFRPVAYFDSRGLPTIGHGFWLGKSDTLEPYANFRLSENVSRIMLIEMVNEYVPIMQRKFRAQWSNMNQDRRIIMLSMMHQLGVSGISKFKKFLAAAAVCDWKTAEIEMLDSKWAKQTPNRAKRHAAVMGGKTIHEVYGDLIK